MHTTTSSDQIESLKSIDEVEIKEEKSHKAGETFHYIHAPSIMAHVPGPPNVADDDSDFATSSDSDFLSSADGSDFDDFEDTEQDEPSLKPSMVDLTLTKAPVLPVMQKSNKHTVIMGKSNFKKTPVALPQLVANAVHANGTSKPQVMDPLATFS